MKKVVFKFSRDLKQTLDEGTYDRMWDKIDEANGVITRVTNSRGADARDLAEAMRDLFDEKKVHFHNHKGWIIFSKRPLTKKVLNALVEFYEEELDDNYNITISVKTLETLLGKDFKITKGE